MKESRDARCWRRSALEFWMQSALKTGGSFGGNRNFCCGGQILKQDRSIKICGKRCIGHNGKNMSSGRKTAENGEDGGLQLEMRRELGQSEALVDELHNILGGGSGQENFGDAGLFQSGDIGFG